MNSNGILKNKNNNYFLKNHQKYLVVSFFIRIFVVGNQNDRLEGFQVLEVCL